MKSARKSLDNSNIYFIFDFDIVPVSWFMIKDEYTVINKILKVSKSNLVAFFNDYFEIHFKFSNVRKIIETLTIHFFLFSSSYRPMSGRL